MKPTKHFRSTPQILLSIVLLATLVACGKKESGGTQVAAKVNKQEVSVHQINFLLQRQQGLKPEQVPEASKRVLEGLIEQELAVQAAQEQKLDRDPRVLMALEQSKREIIARAYVEKLGGAAVKPNEDEITRFFSQKPGLFSQRKIYTLREVNIEATPSEVKDLAAKAKLLKSDDFVAALKAASIKHGTRQVTQSAENIPLDLVDRLLPLPDGGTLVTNTPRGMSVVYLVSTRSAPVTEDQSKAAIEAFITNDRKRTLVQQGMKSLRDAAKITYMGQFAEGAASAAAKEAPPPTFEVAASEGIDERSLQKGLKGLK